MAKTRVSFVCSNCGAESLKWTGRCPQCGEWNTFVEKELSAVSASQFTPAPVHELGSVSVDDASRMVGRFPEFDRVLGGGIVPGSLVLIGGDPGIGKSTLLLQVAAALAQEKGKVLYATGEESLSQLKLRADRLGIEGENLFILPEIRIGGILAQADELAPAMVVIDSIQTVYMEGAGAAGSIGQVRECTMQLMRWAKSNGTPVFLVGHVTKEGAIAGPHVMEHMVDVVLYLEGEQFSTNRILRSAKNRFGSTNEIGIFEMRDRGLFEVTDPSQALLSYRTEGSIGSAVVPTLEGTRPLMVEIQALTNPTSYGMPRRTANGVDFNRLVLLAAVLSRRGGVSLANQDVIANVAGGIRINEPAVDLGIALAIASSFRNMRVAPGLVVVGEIGLSGELRPVSQLDRRVGEAAKLGFETCILPFPLPAGLPPSNGIELRPVGTVMEAIKTALVSR
ncbi:MAG: DNA repair protein RadA [Dehalococcoidia bacterium]